MRRSCPLYATSDPSQFLFTVFKHLLEPYLREYASGIVGAEGKAFVGISRGCPLCRAGKHGEPSADQAQQLLDSIHVTELSGSRY